MAEDKPAALNVAQANDSAVVTLIVDGGSKATLQRLHPTVSPPMCSPAEFGYRIARDQPGDQVR
jgi:hypothetical protein